MNWLNKIHVGDAVPMRAADGRITSGLRISPATEFKPGCSNWRPHRAFRDKDWLLQAYVNEQRSAADIAAQFEVTEGAILHWLRMHEIPRRSVSEARSVKHWGAVGPDNPMYGKRGPEVPSYVSGSTPERQREYGQSEHYNFIRSIYVRDGYRCRRCGSGKIKPRWLQAHHIRSYSEFPELRYVESNLVTLCLPCHRWVHSKKNVDREYLCVNG